MSTIAIERPHAWKRRSGSTRISVLNKGATGVPLLMLNGVGAEYSVWNDLRGNIERPTLAFDVQSHHLGSRPSMRTFARFVRDMLDERHIQQVDVLGLSWGGFAAQQLVHDHPGRVRRLAWRAPHRATTLSPLARLRMLRCFGPTAPPSGPPH